MHPDAEATLDQVRQALDGKVSGEVIAGALMGAASTRVRKQVATGAGTSPKLGQYLLLAATPTRLVLFEAKPAPKTDFVVPRRLIGDWPLDLATIHAQPVRTHNKAGLKTGMWAVAVSVPGEGLEIVLDCAHVPAVDELLATMVAATGGTIIS
jgi:hypothetical protein